MDALPLADILCLALIANRKRKENLGKWCWLNQRLMIRSSDNMFHTIYPRIRSAPVEFFEFYRMSASTFDELRMVLGPMLSRKFPNIRRKISVEEILTLTLYHLSRGARLSALAAAFRLNRAGARRVLWAGLAALAALPPPPARGTPHQFLRRTDFPNCVGALDARIIRVRRKREGTFDSILLITAANVQYRIVAVDVVPCKLRGPHFLRKTAFGRQLLNGEMKFPKPVSLHGDLPHVFVASEAFPTHRRILKPYRGQLSELESTFNRRLDGAQRYAVAALGVLTSKWGVLASRWSQRPRRAARAVRAAVALHNFVIDCEGCDFDHTLSYSFNNKDFPVTLRGPEDPGAADVRDQFADYFAVSEGLIPKRQRQQ